MIINTYKANTGQKHIIICHIGGRRTPGNWSFWFHEDDRAEVVKHRWSMTKLRYAYCTRCGVFLHRLIMKAPDGSIVDHIDRRPENNLRSNLRLVSHAENMRNSKVRQKQLDVPVKGVYWDKSSWMVEIEKNGVRFRKSGFEDLREAICYRIRREYELWGEMSINYRPMLKTMPKHLLNIYFPEIYGHRNHEFIGTPIFKAHYKNSQHKSWKKHVLGVRKAGNPM